MDFEVTGAPVPLAPGVDLTAYRIVQEALTNTIRHARAAQAAVTLRYEPGYITVSVTDSGHRTDGRTPAAGNGTGVGQPGSPLTGAGSSGLGLAGIAAAITAAGAS